MKEPGSGFDLVTASGERERGGSSRPVASRRSISPDPLVEKTVDSASERRLVHPGGPVLRHPVPVGPNVLIYERASSRSRPGAGRSCSSRRTSPTEAQRGAHRGLRRPDLRRGRGAVPPGGAAGPGAQGSLRLTAKQYAEALRLLRAQRPPCTSTGTTRRADRGLPSRAASSPRSGWGYQVNALKAEKAPLRVHHPFGRLHRWADTR